MNKFPAVVLRLYTFKVNRVIKSCYSWHENTTVPRSHCFSFGTVYYASKVTTVNSVNKYSALVIFRSMDKFKCSVVSMIAIPERNINDGSTVTIKDILCNRKFLAFFFLIFGWYDSLRSNLLVERKYEIDRFNRLQFFFSFYVLSFHQVCVKVNNCHLWLSNLV